MINKATEWRLAFARQIAREYCKNPKVQVIVVSGSVSRGQADAYSDIELDLFWQEPPTDEERLRPIKQVNGRLIMFEPCQDDEWSEDYLVNGVQMDVSNFLAATMDHAIAIEVEAVRWQQQPLEQAPPITVHE
jgi:hypothetical protein